VSNESQPYVTITHATSQEISEIRKTEKVPRRVVGDSTPITLGNRKTTVNVAPGSSTGLLYLINQTFQEEHVLNEYAFWHADISLTFTCISSPLSVGHIVFQYLPVTIDTGNSYNSDDVASHFAHQYGIMDIATGKGVTLFLSPIVNFPWYSAPNTARVSREVQHFPGYLKIESIGLDAVFPLTIQCTISFDNLKVCVPLKTIQATRMNDFELVQAQMSDSPSSDVSNSATPGPSASSGNLGFGSSNPVAFGAGYHKISMFNKLPHATDDDMSFDNLSDQFPVYVGLGEVGSTPVSFDLMGYSVAQKKYLLYNNVFAQQPILALLNSFQLKAADMHVTLYAVKNNFQTCFSKVSYGFLPAGATRSSQPQMFEPKYLSHIDWNMTTQNTLDFVVPWVNNARLDSTLRHLITLQFSAVTPTLTGIAEKIYIYALIRFKNVRLSIPNTIETVIDNAPPPVTYENFDLVKEQSGETTPFNLLENTSDFAPQVFTNFRQLAAMRTRIFENADRQTVTLPRYTKIEINDTAVTGLVSPFTIALDCAVNFSGTPSVWLDSNLLPVGGAYPLMGYPVSYAATLVRKPFYTVHFGVAQSYAVGPESTDFVYDALSFEQCDFANFIFPFITP
jgi:hypothetical protein